MYQWFVQRLMPSAVRLQLVSPTRELPVRPGWVHEPKIDGVRLLLGKDGTTVQLRVRGGGLVQRVFPEVVESVRRLQAEHVVLDGELVVLDEFGQADFDAICTRLRSDSPSPGPRVVVYVFDCLGLHGEDLRPRSLRERKAVLSTILGNGGAVLKPMPFIEGPPEPLVESVMELGMEGVVSKYLGAPYHGGRSSLWRKIILRRPEKGWRVAQPASAN
jgi:bifunctional non-homologous end joining protein LigD